MRFLAGSGFNEYGSETLVMMVIVTVMVIRHHMIIVTKTVTHSDTVTVTVTNMDMMTILFKITANRPCLWSRNCQKRKKKTIIVLIF